MRKFTMKAVIAVAAIILCADAWGQATLDEELKALYEKYGRDSVVGKVERDNPKAKEAAVKSEVDGALAPKKDTEKSEVSGFVLYKDQPFKLLIRRSYSEVTTTEDRTVKGGKDLRKAEDAQFSYLHDYLTGADQWSVIAAVITPFDLIRNTSAPALSEGLALQVLQFVPSVSLNRVTNNKDEDKEIDELTYRAGLFSQWLGKAGPVRLVNLSGYATYATNTGFTGGGTIAGEVDLEPLTNLPGNRVFRRLFGNGSGVDGSEGPLVEYHWKAYLHNEFGRHTGSSTAQDDDNNFFRTGPVLSLDLDPLFFPRLNASIGYSYLVGISGNPSNSHHLMAKLGFVLDRLLDTDRSSDANRSADTDHWTINATYEDGDTPLVQNRVRTFLLSLGIKY